MCECCTPKRTMFSPMLWVWAIGIASIGLFARAATVVAIGVFLGELALIARGVLRR